MSLRRIVSCWILALLCIAATEGRAQQKAGSLPNGGGPAWSSAHEITVSGQIAEMPKAKVPGSPPGLNFLLNGTQHTLMVNAGTSLSESLRSKLQSGVPIGVTGVIESFNGQDYLLARELVVNGTTVQVRNASGFPVRPIGEAGPQTRSAKSRATGGAR